MITFVAILAGVALGYAAGALFMPASEGASMGGRVALSALGGLVGWWGASLAGGREPIVWASEVAQVRSTQDFENLVAASDREPILVDFYANWCPPCRRAAPGINDLAKEGRRVAVVNVDENPALAQRFDVSVIPTLLILRGGEVAAQTQGYHSPEDLRRMLGQ